MRGRWRLLLRRIRRLRQRDGAIRVGVSPAILRPGERTVSRKIRTAIVTGVHPYDVIRFNELWRSFREVDPYIQHMEDFVSSAEEARDSYDAVVFYHMIMAPVAEQAAAVLQRVAQRGQGMVVLHHALLAWPGWAFWNDLVGIRERGFGYHYGQSIKVNVRETPHPVLSGTGSWEMTDETYTMQEPDPGSNSDILLTVEHDKSMRAIAWTRAVGSSRVFCFQSGHDAQAWTDTSFRRVLLRGALWCARRI